MEFIDERIQNIKHTHQKNTHFSGQLKSRKITSKKILLGIFTEKVNINKGFKLLLNGETIDRLALNSQVRFQNDLEIDNLQAKHSGDYDEDGIHEVYWKTADGTAYLRSLMHDDGNIRYANYQSEAQMKEYLTANGDDSVIADITS